MITNFIWNPKRAAIEEKPAKTPPAAVLKSPNFCVGSNLSADRQAL